MRWPLLTTLVAALIAAPSFAAEGYTMDDFEKIPKIDAHLHLHGKNQDAWLALARKENFRALTINVDYPDFPSLDQQRKVASALRHQHPRQVAWVATFSTDGFDQPGWNEATLKSIDAALADGAVGVKVWKNIGMSLRDGQGKLVMIDDARFTPLFNGLTQRGAMVLGHQGEPHNCWLPIEKMSVNNDREYFKNHPAYHMYLHPEMPSYEQQMAARDHLLAQHPKMRFTGVHLASMEYDVGRIGRFLDEHPGVRLDVAARIGQLQYQSQRHLETIRAFFIKYQDRLMYGSDLAQSAEQDDAAFVADMGTIWRRDWRYFVTGDSFAVPELDKPVRGLALPRAVIDKLYRINAEQAYPTAWQ